MHTYSEERNSDDDAPVLGARQLVDGVADVAVVLLGGAAEAGAGGDSFGGHVCCMCEVVLVVRLETMWLMAVVINDDDVVCGCWIGKLLGARRESGFRGCLRVVAARLLVRQGLLQAIFNAYLIDG